MRLPGWAKEPLVHFLAAGAVLFLLFAWMGEEPDPTSRTINVTQADRARLSLQWEQTMGRPPTDAELDGLTQQFIREEVLYREALRLGLDRDDAVLRKRLASKMDYLATSMAETRQPSDAQLAQWLKDHPQRFASDGATSFDQIYFVEQASAKAALARGIPQEWGRAGEPISLPATVNDSSNRAVEEKFGRRFADELAAMPANGRWTGPIASGFGWHLVRVRARSEGTVPPLADIRRDVENDWRAATLKQRREDAYGVLHDGYRIRIER